MVIVCSAFVAGIGLFGGWYFYQSYALQKPLDEEVQAVNGITDVSVEINQTEFVISFRPEPGLDLRDTIQQLTDISHSYHQDKTIRFVLLQDRSEVLEEWWSLALFDIAEAMENKTYGSIPEVLEARKPDLPGLNVRADIDEAYVYVYLERSGETKYILLPRQPIMLKGGPNHA